MLSNFPRDIIEDVTSPIFEGLVALREPTRSWVARWQRIDGYEKGVYAVKVSGNVRDQSSKPSSRTNPSRPLYPITDRLLQLPEEILRELDGSNIVYRPRDGSYVVED